MEDRRKMTNSSRYLRRHSIYSRNQRRISCDEKLLLNRCNGLSPELPDLKIELVCQSLKDATSCSEGPKLAESGTDDHGYFSLATGDTLSPCPVKTEPELRVGCPFKLPYLTPVAPKQRFSRCNDASPAGTDVQLPVKPEYVKLEPLDGDLEEVLDIGNPIFESSTCQSLYTTVDASAEQVSEVKSEEEVSIPAPCQPQTTENLPGNGKRHRSVPSNEDEWERKRDRFMDLVRAHMRERPQSDVFQELNSLMSRVTDQSAGPHREHWQHPSDFSRRNHFARFGKKEQMTLRRWQDVNNQMHKRFSNVPRSFARSQPY